MVSHELRQGLEAQGGRADLLEWRLKQAEGRLSRQVGLVVWGAMGISCDYEAMCLR